jgi:tRNA threonylcarbamoyl adenosine modification protein YeaZ
MGSRVILAMDGSTNASTTALLVRGGAQEAGTQVAGAQGLDAQSGACGAWQVLAERTDLDSRGQARVLLRLVQDMLQETGRAQEDIGAIVAGIGPGTFTGVRIAVATARALALALDVPILGVSTLSALAAEAAASQESRGGAVPDVIVPVVDARRGQLFYGVYRRSGDAFARTEPFAVCDRGALVACVASGAQTLIVGDVAGLEAPEGGPDVCFLPLQVRAVRLVAGQSALEEPGEGIEGSRLSGCLGESIVRARRAASWEPGELGSPESVKPIYVRSPDADIHITKMRDPWADAAAER